MSRNLQDLQPDFKNKVIAVIKRCANDKITMKPFYTYRSLQEQAKLWRQSRSTAEIEKKLEWLRSKDAYYLASIIDGVGAQSGRWATNAIPGMSAHNYGLAVDCYLEIDGVACWDSDNVGYSVYAKHAKNLELDAGHFWRSKDSVHIQEFMDKKTIKEINDYFKG